jgi:hypothetical protein
VIEGKQKRIWARGIVSEIREKRSCTVILSHQYSQMSIIQINVSLVILEQNF